MSEDKQKIILDDRQAREESRQKVIGEDHSVETNIGITDDNEVLIQYSKPISWVALGPESAIELGRIMIKQGKTAMELAKPSKKRANLKVVKSEEQQVH